MTDNNKHKNDEDISPAESEQTADSVEDSSADDNTNNSNDESEELKALKDRVDSLENQLKRAIADYHNLEKRVAEGRSELAVWATNELLAKLLPSLDYFEQAVSGATEEDQKSGWFKGVQMALQHFRQVLKEEGLEEIKTNDGFDPILHEAVDTKGGQDGEILEVAQKGYNLHGKVLRPAKVIVGKGEK